MQHGQSQMKMSGMPASAAAGGAAASTSAAAAAALNSSNDAYPPYSHHGQDNSYPASTAAAASAPAVTAAAAAAGQNESLYEALLRYHADNDDEATVDGSVFQQGPPPPFARLKKDEDYDDNSVIAEYSKATAAETPRTYPPQFPPNNSNSMKPPPPSYPQQPTATAIASSSIPAHATSAAAAAAAPTTSMAKNAATSQIPSEEPRIRSFSNTGEIARRHSNDNGIFMSSTQFDDDHQPTIQSNDTAQVKLKSPPPSFYTSLEAGTSRTNTKSPPATTAKSTPSSPTTRKKAGISSPFKIPPSKQKTASSAPGISHVDEPVVRTDSLMYRQVFGETPQPRSTSSNASGNSSSVPAPLSVNETRTMLVALKEQRKISKREMASQKEESEDFEFVEQNGAQLKKTSDSGKPVTSSKPPPPLLSAANAEIPLKKAPPPLPQKVQEQPFDPTNNSSGNLKMAIPTIPSSSSASSNTSINRRTKKVPSTPGSKSTPSSPTLPTHRKRAPRDVSPPFSARLKNQSSDRGHSRPVDRERGSSPYPSASDIDMVPATGSTVRFPDDMSKSTARKTAPVEKYMGVYDDHGTQHSTRHNPTSNTTSNQQKQSQHHMGSEMSKEIADHHYSHSVPKEFSEMHHQPTTQRPNYNAAPPVRSTPNPPPDEDMDADLWLALELSRQEADEAAAMNASQHDQTQHHHASNSYPSDNRHTNGTSSTMTGTPTATTTSYSVHSPPKPTTNNHVSSQMQNSAMNDDQSVGSLQDVLLALRLSEEDATAGAPTDFSTPDTLRKKKRKNKKSSRSRSSGSSQNQGQVADEVRRGSIHFEDFLAYEMQGVMSRKGVLNPNEKATDFVAAGISPDPSSQPTEQWRILEQIREEQERKELHLALQVSKQIVDVTTSYSPAAGNNSGTSDEEFLLSQQQEMEKWSSNNNYEATDEPTELNRATSSSRPPLTRAMSSKSIASVESVERRRELVKRGTVETQQAITTGKAHIVICRGCNGRLQAPVSYALVFCPKCETISPV